MSSLKLNELFIERDRRIAYREKFHSGVNIIRGDNSSGKSTISNFIFFALGGEFTDWLPEATSCNYVYAEVELNGVVITLKREIQRTQMRAMSIFFGGLEDSLKSNSDGWQTYSYKKSSSAESFSQVIFKTLGFPEVSTENQDSITVNQILRLSYIDQMSFVDSLMRNENFDSPLIRLAVGNLLLGTYDDDLLKKQMTLKQMNRELIKITGQIDALDEVLRNSNFEFDKKKIELSLTEKRDQLTRVLNGLNKTDIIEPNNKSDESEAVDIKSLRNKLISAKCKYDEILSALNKTKVSIIDSSDFIETLRSKLIAIQESLNSHDILENMPLQHCPLCAQKLENPITETHCKLCKQEIKETQGKSKLLRMRLEIERQINESMKMLEETENKRKYLANTLKEHSRSLENAQSDYNVYIHQSKTSVEMKFDQLFEHKGRLNAEIDFLEKQMQLTDSYLDYINIKHSLDVQIKKLGEAIKQREDCQQKNSLNAFTMIQHYALKLLNGDGAYEDKFQNGHSIQLDFRKDSFSIDERSNFSASSMVLLKNSVRFAIFFASLELDYFRYPKFILCDNIEDKGMVEARSKNFQRNIVNLANSEQLKNKEFQIIMTTSMIDETLDIPEYTVGKKYTKEYKSLCLE